MYYTNLSGLSKKQIKKELVKAYSSWLSQMQTEMTAKQTRKQVKRWIKICKKDAKKEGDITMKNYGDYLIKASESGIPDAKKMVEVAREEGATDEDIREYWNLHYLQRRMHIVFYSDILVACFEMGENEGLSSTEAANKLRKYFPLYGDSEWDANDGYNYNYSKEDRPLPFELRARVEIHKEKLGDDIMWKKLSEYSSYNAFVRAEIKKGNL